MIKSLIDKDTFFMPEHVSFALSEAQSPYVLYASIEALSFEIAKAQWNGAEGSVPDGWKAVSDSIPAGTQHYVYDNVPGTIFRAVGLSDGDNIIMIH